MPTVKKPPSAAELAAIKARGVAAGFKPTAAAVTATYNRNQARAGPRRRPPTAGAPKPPSAAELAAIKARGVAAGFKPTAVGVRATATRNAARTAKAAGAAALKAATKAAPAPPGWRDLGPTTGENVDEAYAYSQRPGVTDGSTVFGNAYLNDFLTRLKAGETPKQIQESNAAKFGGHESGGGGPEQNLTADQYAELILTQYEGSDNAGTIDVAKGMSPAGKKAWARYLAGKGPSGYVGPNVGSGGGPNGVSVERARELNAQEWRRNMELAGHNSGLSAGRRYGFGYDDNGRPLTDAELIAAVRGAGQGG